MRLPSTFSETTINAAFGNVLLTWYIEKLVCCEPSSIQVNLLAASLLKRMHNVLRQQQISHPQNDIDSHSNRFTLKQLFSLWNGCNEVHTNPTDNCVLPNRRSKLPSLLFLCWPRNV
jgi:hypothetical protein